MQRARRSSVTTKMLILQGGLYTGIAAINHIVTTLGTDMPINVRTLICLVGGALVAAGTSLKAFLSTTFSQSANGAKPQT